MSVLPGSRLQEGRPPPGPPPQSTRGRHRAPLSEPRSKAGSPGVVHGKGRPTVEDTENRQEDATNELLNMSNLVSSSVQRGGHPLRNCFKRTQTHQYKASKAPRNYEVDFTPRFPGTLAFPVLCGPHYLVSHPSPVTALPTSGRSPAQRPRNAPTRAIRPAHSFPKALPSRSTGRRTEHRQSAPFAHTLSIKGRPHPESYLCQTLNKVIKQSQGYFLPGSRARSS